MAVNQGLPTWAATLVLGAHRHRLQFGTFDQTQCNTQIMEPFLQFAVHKAPSRENQATGNAPVANTDHRSKFSF
ncbi:hypothetical protein PSCICL_34320 [Pseudomonas cichorii]|nr:hypothetical protein PSCICE_22950 [Pseudomonas cichorii]GFM59708.1 hypothetical protein PSCICG_08680 [Pseudomonas cichorii]GFM72440.1 hypothetical protein PSCICL_34320 [Pseudomonas cichorii]